MTDFSIRGPYATNPVTEAECFAYLEATWVDMRPLSPRKLLGVA